MRSFLGFVPDFVPHFTVATDHKPLEGIFAKDLYDIWNPRHQRLREKLVEYNFTVKSVPIISQMLCPELLCSARKKQKTCILTLLECA